MEFLIEILFFKIFDLRLFFGIWFVGYNFNILKRMDINLIN